ncbi:UDP-N-acetylmuramoylalanyl-D-glutamyl-2, 6-diaminopimelate--D-alanalanyl ligase [Salmonella enterica subsp. arizonae]|nr:UDP-N-acetylmuramoylalanyl-D-glutamyl-2, 6-diaminopimelate--D-alanalanyl ligase [Salmonella enterica subsp. arizonae]
MISVTLSKIADVLGAEHRGADLTLDTVITDTRKVTPGCLFVALKGERFDAHDFADKAKANGAGALLVSRPLDIDLPQVIVKDTRQAFGQLAAWGTYASAGAGGRVNRFVRQNLCQRDGRRYS